MLFFKKVNFKKGIASSLNNQGAIYYYLGNYPKALEYYKKAMILYEALNDETKIATTTQNIGGIYLELDDLSGAMKNFQTAKKVYEKTSDTKSLSQVLNSIGDVYLKFKNHEKALVSLQKALKYATENKEKQIELEVLFNLGKLFQSQNLFAKSVDYYSRSLQLSEEMKSDLYISSSLIKLGLIKGAFNKILEAIKNCRKGLKIAKRIEVISIQEEACKCLYNSYKSSNQAKKALSYYEQMHLLKDSLNLKKTTDKILNMKFEKEMLIDSIAHVEKERRVQIKHKVEVEKKEKQRNVFIIVGCFALVLAISVFSRLNFVKKSKARLQIEKDRSEHLLLNILPEEIAEELKEKGFVDAQDFETATILFTDFKSFTETASLLTPQELVEEINVCFKAFDNIIEHYNIEKIKTIGDAYMAAGGLPKPDVNAVKNTILAAIDMQGFVGKRKLENDAQKKPAFDMRVGIHVGPIVAGIVGVKKFQYDVWGDTVNTASRMESNSEVGKVNISESTYLLVKNEKDLFFEYRGKVAVKGKGKLKMYFVSKA
ncbi:tetratricopeptide repeat protein [Tenacibaculum ovolyticum]|nr:adenylate/guanylate cyclase domain-containing protein [Tenacibaculum ovolyticum]WBX76785.1 tetratricopeptide repeat protein [Tenacibaculum ovolyticum]